MKILKLVFENINSLKGKWQIDFEDPAFHNHALFTITGPTGAGKTTILDAICLALYGETPRLTVSVNQNELMSIGTAFAASTVIFRANDKLYQASWSQRRAKQKSDGKLQAVSRELSELKDSHDINGKIIEEKTSLVNNQIEEILGMNKTQFTRSVMLVQGEFAAFLRSSATERGQILEQITGTQIYAQISQAAFKKQKKQAHLLKDLQLKLEEVQLLSPDDYQALVDKIALINDQKHQTKIELQTIENKLNLANQYTALTQDITHWQNKIEQNQSDIDEFSEDLLRLDHGKHAQILEPLYQTVEELNESHRLKISEKLTLAHSLSTLQDRVTHHQEHQKSIQDKLNEKLKDYEKIKPHLQAARQLDVKIVTAKQHKSHLQQTLNKSDNDLNHSKQIVKKLHDDQQRIQADVNRLTKESHQHTLEDVSADLYKKEQNLSQFHALSQAMLHSHYLYLNGIDKLQNSLSSLENLRTNYHSITEQIQQKSTELQSQKSAFYNLLKLNNISNENAEQLKQHLNTIQQTIKSSSHTLQALEQIKDYDQQHQPLVDEIHLLSQQALELDNKQASVNDALQSLHDKIQQTRQSQSIQLENLSLQTQILHLKAQLEQLNEGDPCPLCGSTEHPYKHLTHSDEVDDATQAQANLDAIESSLNELSMQYEEQKSSLQALIITKENTAYKSNSLHHNSQNILQKMYDLWAGIQDHFSDCDALPTRQTMDDLIHKTQTKLSRLEQVFDDANALIGQIQIGETALDKRLYEKQSIEATGTKIGQDIKVTLLDLHATGCHLEQKSLTPMIRLLDATDDFDGSHELKSHLVTLKNTLLDLSEVVKFIEQNPDNLKQISSQVGEITTPNHADGTLIDHAHAAMSRICTDLKTQITKVKAQNDAIGQMQSELAHLATKIDMHQNKIQELSPEVENLHTAIQAVSADIQTLHADRVALIKETDIDTLEQSHQSDINHLRTALENHTAQLQSDLVTLEAQKTKTANLDTAIDELVKKLTLNKNLYQEALHESIFENEAQFFAARLSKEQLTTLQHSADQLQDALKQSQISLQNSQLKRDELLDTDADIAKLDLEMLQDQLAQLQTTWTLIHQQIGEMSAIKTTELNNRQRQAALIADIEKQQQDNAIWSQLNALIGSENGNKYRNFVQGLTLDLVLQHANQILSKMNDRYLLTTDKDEDKSLEILVTDLHQGDAIRSSKNLSGGESFIISLALALGLSQINSKNVQIESLFLDEGFGTLDESALDLALSTLFELQQSGKSIGIISHVASLKERIDTQIIVEKHAAGHSMLYGAGVTQLG